MLQGGRDDHGCCEIDEHRMIILGVKDSSMMRGSNSHHPCPTICQKMFVISVPFPTNDICMSLEVGIWITVKLVLYIDSRWKPTNGPKWR